MALVILGIIVFIIGFIVSKSASQLARYKTLIKSAGIVLVVVGILLSGVRQISAGHVGVQSLFGQVQTGVIYEGLSLVNPLVDIKEMSYQTQNYTMSGVYEEGQKKGDDAIRVLSNDGLEVIIDMTVLFRIIPSEAPKIYREIGVDYQDKLIRPVTRAGIRESASYFNAIDLIAEKREQFSHKIRAKIEDGFKSRGIVLEQLLVRDINLPKPVKESIERKITAVQDAQRMQFVLQKETQEAERKRVEAKGVADAQKIVNEGLSDRVLQFEMIKMQKEIANSPNSKIIFMGGGKSTPPLIIGGDK